MKVLIKLEYIDRVSINQIFTSKSSHKSIVEITELTDCDTISKWLHPIDGGQIKL